MSESYQGSCHCGSIKFSYTGEKITKGARCNCSLCSRKGSLMSTELIPEQELKIDAVEGMLGLYQFGLKTAQHFFCKNCGNYVFHETARKAGHYRVNLACIESIDTFALEVEVFDGKHLL